MIAKKGWIRCSTHSCSITKEEIMSGAVLVLHILISPVMPLAFRVLPLYLIPLKEIIPRLLMSLLTPLPRSLSADIVSPLVVIAHGRYNRLQVATEKTPVTFCSHVPVNSLFASSRSSREQHDFWVYWYSRSKEYLILCWSSWSQKQYHSIERAWLVVAHACEWWRTMFVSWVGACCNRYFVIKRWSYCGVVNSDFRPLMPPVHRSNWHG